MDKQSAKAREFTLSATGNEFPSVKCISSKEAVDYVRQFYHDDIAIYESAFILLLNQAMQTIGWAKISQGGLVGTVVDVRIIAKYAIDSLSSNVIFVHNHPSGNIKPSIQDETLTKKIKSGLSLLDVRLTDSIIITPTNDYYSFKDEGRL